tara:strand:- start:2683 stop:4311 length:1629 start_codon:yes stop_codon:yes gene_type:complete
MDTFKSILNGVVGKWPLQFGGDIQDEWRIELTRTIAYGQKQNIYTLWWYGENIYKITTKNSTSRSDDEDEFSSPTDLLEQVTESLTIFQNYILTNYDSTDLYFETWESLPILGVFEPLFPTNQNFYSEFTTSSRIIDKDTGLPMKGVDVEIKTKDSENEEQVYSTKTDGNGQWVLQWKCLIIYPNYGDDVVYKVVNKDLNFTFNKEGYNTQRKSALTGKNQIRNFIPLIKLDSKEKSKAQDLSKIGTLEDKDVKIINKGGVKNPANISKLIKEQVKIIVNRLIPVIIGMLAQLGITQINKWLDGQNNLNNTDTKCPEDQESIKALIAKRNRLVRQLNNIYRVVDAAVKGLGVLASLISIFKTIINIFKNMPLPTTIGLPPGPQGGVITSASYGKVASYIEKFDKIKEKVDLIEKLTLAVLSALVLLRIYLLKALQLLKILDNKLDQCSQGLNIEQEELDNELTALLLAEEEDGNVVVIDVNGFTMGIEISKIKIGSLNRRFATASNAQGVVLLRGEPSFSASDQVLIDELVFYIQSNNLKAQ